MQQHAALGLLVAISCLLIAHHDGAAVAAALPACQVNTADTSVVSENCLLSSPLLASASGIVRLVGGVLQPQLPLVVVSSSSKATAGTGGCVARPWTCSCSLSCSFCSPTPALFGPPDRPRANLPSPFTTPSRRQPHSREPGAHTPGAGWR